MKIFTFVIAILVNVSAFASGVLSIEGKMFGKTNDSFVILVDKQLYTIQKSDLTKNQREILERAKWKSPVSLQVSFDAISQVKDVPKN